MSMYVYIAAAVAGFALIAIVVLLIFLLNGNKTNTQQSGTYGNGQQGYNGSSQQYGSNGQTQYNKNVENMNGAKPSPVRGNNGFVSAPQNDDDSKTVAVNIDYGNNSTVAEGNSKMVTFTNNTTGEKITRSAANGIKIGRRQSNDIVVSDKRVSGEHCRLSYTGGIMYIEDAGSTNGTVLNGTMLEGRGQVEDGNWILIGDTQFTINF